ncbi:Transposase DDE domain-containing protein [Methylomagnum ishizawai]|uniref:Transposase DDE domain-containing protein n=1 Tax=Methylomagnum ishizawai TaxID=1760988 RepID=A0A1Y6CVL2_9GAMM|nr:transposase [Methylomagnum ishizawai]SMF94689.1 Transposase DDE domain-containing protein [Methylomagnum ishizawai]SMF95681.1 Transposase DDE domain-containing protein [Methylomagnum ishizawai]
MLELFRQKMPLSCLLYGLLERCFSAERLDRIFLENAKEQYTREILFSTVCDLMLSVVLKVHPSINAAYQKQPEPLGVTVSALYEKLKGVELPVSQALLRDTSEDLSAILDALGFIPEPWLPGYPVRILDGNCLAASEKRLAVHQNVSGAALPGKSLVVFDPERRLMRDVFPCEDGHAQERRLLDAVADSMKAGELWIADRNFCTLGLLGQVHGRGAYALMRLHQNLPLTEETLFSCADENAGRRLLEKRVGVAGRPYRLVRVELEQPSRDGDAFIDLLTDLPAEIPAAAVADLYRRCWTLETAFQHVEKHFNSEIETLAYPKAALFGFAVALVAYNIFSVMISALDCAHQKPVSKDISGYYIAHEIAATFLALIQLGEGLDWRFVAACAPPEFAAWLRDTARHVNLRALKKHSRGPKQPKTKPPYDPKQPHVSTYQLLRGKK